MAGVPWSLIVGGAMDTIGTAIMAGGADKRKREAKALANTPGVDITGTTGQALEGYEQNYAKAAAISRKVSESNQAQLLAQEEQSLPGLGDARKEALGRIRGLFSEDSEWLRGVQRRGAALGLSSGLFGSGAGQLQTLHLSDQEQMQRTQLGTGLLGSLIGSMRIANSPGAQAFLGPSPSEQVATRSNERALRLQMLSGANAMPNYWETWGQRFQQVGATLAGADVGAQSMGTGGTMSGSGAFGGGGGRMPNSTQQSMMNADYTGASNMGWAY